MVTPQPTSLLPSPTLQITRFLQFVKNVYADLPKTMVSHSLFWGAKFTTCVSDVATAVAFIFSQTSLFEPGEGEIPEDTSKGSSVSVECWHHWFFLHLADLWSSLYVPLVSCTPPVCASQGSHLSEGVGRTAHHCGTHVPGKVPYTIYGISAPPMCSCKLMIAIVCCISDSLYMYVGVACTYSSFPPPPAVQANSAHYSSGLHPPHNEDHCAAAFS